MQTEKQIGAQFIPKLVKHRIERRIRSGTVVYMKRNATTRKPKMNELKLSSILIFNLSLSNQKRKTESRNYLQLISAFQSINKTATSIFPAHFAYLPSVLSHNSETGKQCGQRPHPFQLLTRLLYLVIILLFFLFCSMGFLKIKWKKSIFETTNTMN